MTESLDVPFKLVHVDEQPSPLASVTEGRTPSVAARIRDSGFEALPGPEQLGSAEGSVERFATLLRQALGG